MPKINPKIEITQIDESVKQKIRARDEIDLAPRPALTAANNTVISTGSVGSFVEAANSTALENMRTRINEIETALIKLGLIKSP